MPPAGFEPPNPSKRAATDPRLRPRGHWNRVYVHLFGVFEEASTRMHGTGNFKTVCHSWVAEFFHFIETFVLCVYRYLQRTAKVSGELRCKFFVN